MEERHTLLIMLREIPCLETALDVQCPFSFDDAAKIVKLVRIREVSILNLEWVSVAGVQWHNLNRPVSNVETDLLAKILSRRVFSLM